MLVNGVEVKGLKEFNYGDWADESFTDAMAEKYSFFLDTDDNKLYISMATLKPLIPSKEVYEHASCFYWNYCQDDGLYVIPLEVLLEDEKYSHSVSELVKDLEAYRV